MAEFVRWHPKQWAKAQGLLARGMTPSQVAPLIGKTAHQLSEKVRWENTPESKREQRRLRINARRNASGEYKSPPDVNLPSMGARAAPDLLEEARRRLEAPRTLSQMLMGDPPPGYSALDRKRQNIPEPLYLDARMAQLQRVPSLAGSEV